MMMKKLFVSFMLSKKFSLSVTSDMLRSLPNGRFQWHRVPVVQLIRCIINFTSNTLKRLLKLFSPINIFHQPPKMSQIGWIDNFNNKIYNGFLRKRMGDNLYLIGSAIHPAVYNNSSPNYKRWIKDWLWLTEFSGAYEMFSFHYPKTLN